MSVYIQNLKEEITTQHSGYCRDTCNSQGSIPCKCGSQIQPFSNHFHSYVTHLAQGVKFSFFSEISQIMVISSLMFWNGETYCTRVIEGEL